MAAKAGKAGRLRVDAHRNREQIIAAARDVFSEQGADAPLEEIARRAGVGIATLYRRFPDRHALIRRIAMANMAVLLDEMDRAYAGQPDSWSVLVQILRRVVETRVGIVIPVLAPDFSRELGDDEEMWTLREQVFGRVERLVRDARREGRLRRDIGAGDIMLGTIKLCRPMPGLDSETNDLMAERHLATFIDGLRATEQDDPGVRRTTLRGRPLTLAGLDRHRIVPGPAVPGPAVPGPAVPGPAVR